MTEQFEVTIRVLGKDREDVLRKLTAAADDFFQGPPYMLSGGILTTAETETYVTPSGVESKVIGYSATADYVSLDDYEAE